MDKQDEENMLLRRLLAESKESTHAAEERAREAEGLFGHYKRERDKLEDENRSLSALIDGDGKKIDALAAQVEKLREALKIGIDEAKSSLNACGPCEHEVNICVCGLVRDIAEMEEALSLSAPAALEAVKREVWEEAAKIAETLPTLHAWLPLSEGDPNHHVTRHGIEIAKALRSRAVPPTGKGEM
jgi:chromosome segregation ATPase